MSKANEASYNSFLEHILLLAKQEFPDLSIEEYMDSHVWKYMAKYFGIHESAIVALLIAWYAPDNAFLRETLSWEHPIIRISDTKTFEESYWSGKSDLVPSVTFVKEGESNDSADTPLIRIEFWDTGIAGID